MATYTTPLRTLIEQPTQHRNDLKFNERLEVGRVVLFDFDYPMFDSRYKKVFETNFINNFYDREIGFETEHLFKRRLENWLRINMGYYSELMRSETLKFDPFINSEVHVTHNKKNDETSKSDKNFGETTSTDVSDKTVTDEDTTKSTERDSTVDTTNTTDRDSIVDTTNTTDRDSVVDTTNKTDRDSVVDTTNNTDRDSTVDTQTDGTTNVEGETSGQSSGTSKTTENSETDSTSSGTTTTDEFKRDLHTDTPDTRLAISTNEGQGTVGYASTIDESKSKGTQTTSNTGNETTESTTDNTTSDTTSTTSQQDETTSETGLSKENTNVSEIGKSTEDTSVDEVGKSTEDTSVDEVGKSTEDTNVDEVGKSIEDTDIDEIGTRDEIIDRIVERLGKRDFDEVTDGTVNSIEDFVQHRYGKIGVQTYSKMLMEYRQTFLRIEKEIFDEMNQLFMLVY